MHSPHRASWAAERCVYSASRLVESAKNVWENCAASFALSVGERRRRGDWTKLPSVWLNLFFLVQFLTRLPLNVNKTAACTSVTGVRELPRCHNKLAELSSSTGAWGECENRIFFGGKISVRRWWLSRRWWRYVFFSLRFFFLSSRYLHSMRERTLCGVWCGMMRYVWSASLSLSMCASRHFPDRSNTLYCVSCSLIALKNREKVSSEKSSTRVENTQHLSPSSSVIVFLSYCSYRVWMELRRARVNFEEEKISFKFLKIEGRTREIYLHIIFCFEKL